MKEEELVREVILRSLATDGVLWRVVDRRPVSQILETTPPEVYSFTLGITPPAFSQRVPLREPLSGSESYSVTISGSNQEGYPFVHFQPQDLDEQEVFGPVEAPLEEFVQRASDECRPPRPPFGGLFTGPGGAVALAVLLVVGLWIMFKLTVRRRTPLHRMAP